MPTSKYSEGVTGVGHPRGSSEGVTRGGHRRGSSEGVTGGGHQRRSPEGVTKGGHRRGSLKASIESCLLHVEFNYKCLQIRFHSVVQTVPNFVMKIEINQIRKNSLR